MPFLDDFELVSNLRLQQAKALIDLVESLCPGSLSTRLPYNVSARASTSLCQTLWCIIRWCMACLSACSFSCLVWCKSRVYLRDTESDYYSGPHGASGILVSLRADTCLSFSNSNFNNGSLPFLSINNYVAHILHSSFPWTAAPRLHHDGQT